MVNLKLGKKPARADAVKLKLAAALPAQTLPVPPIWFGIPWAVANWQMLSNDSVGDCVWAGAAHETMLWRALAGVSVSFTDADVLADYAAVTGYRAGDPATDQGTDMQQAASYRLKTGILDAAGNRHKIDAYAAIAPGNTDELALAAYLFGAAGVGLQLPASAIDQFNYGEMWNDNQGSEIAGGHYVPCIGRTTRGNFLVVTWGRLHAATPAFLAKYMDEGLAYVSFEKLRALSPDLEAAMRAQLAAVTSGSTTNSTSTSTTEAKMAATPTKLVATELQAARDAVNKVLAARIPSWERGFIPNEVLDEAISEAVSAIDDVRDRSK